MNAAELAGEPEEASAELSVNTRMALIRTRLAFERTLTAWVRTAVSLITFGFTLYKAVEVLQNRLPHQQAVFLTAHHFGLAVLLVGLVALLLATLQHWRHVAMLRELDTELPIVSVGLVVALLFTGIGAWAVIGILLRG